MFPKCTSLLLLMPRADTMCCLLASGECSGGSMFGWQGHDCRFLNFRFFCCLNLLYTRLHLVCGKIHDPDFFSSVFTANDALLRRQGVRPKYVFQIEILSVYMKSWALSNLV